ncbi:phospholipase D active site motif-containing protein [Pyronema omphalodes]|nr:phospholipase D active site motif-containing protein [Pyronema omphalodes]
MSTNVNEAQGNRALLPPITLNTQVPPAKKSNGTISASAKRPNPIPSLAPLEPTPLPRRASRNLSQLDEMEPPPPIPAAVEERGFRSRPSSTHSEMMSGYLTPGRRSSNGSGSTTAWAGHSPDDHGTKGGKRRTGFFSRNNNESTASVDDADNELDYTGGASTPRSRRSVVFERGARRSGDYSTGDELDTPGGPKRPSFFQRLRNFGSNHGRTQSGWTIGSQDDTESPFTPNTPNLPYAASDGGVLIDEGAESEDLPPTRRSFSPARYGNGSMSAPATPRLGPSSNRRRRTMANVTSGEDVNDGDETDRSRSRYGFSRRSSFRNRVTKRRSTDDGPRQRTSYMPNYRASTVGWHRLKAGIKAIGKRQKEESKIDREKSAELVAELSAATPAAIILASMFQRDEHGQRRIPVLLEQLKVQITDSHHSQRGGGRYQTTFKLELEYGSGLTRMKWIIHREFRDFFNLHSRYRLAIISDTTFSRGVEQHKLPKFPRGTIPYLRGVRGLGSDDESDDGLSGAEKSTDPKKKKQAARRNSSALEDLDDVTRTGIAAAMTTFAGIGGASVQQAMVKSGRDGFNQRQRQQLEEYLRKLIRIMIFRPDSNRLCKFLELSALGIRLAAEGSYHGKEGYLIIRSSKGSDFRRPWNPSTVAKRHAPKWFLVRHSYIVCVDSPEEMNIYDVFLVDSNFKVETKRFLSKAVEDATGVNPSNPRPQHHRLSIQNHERKVKLLAKNERQLQQFKASMEFMANNSEWSQRQRFDSFAPVRKAVFAQWLVDGRDYFWNVSRAISMAKDVIYIHDWWLSPELYLRRPAAVSQKWRLDRLLQKKAEEGVKIFVIVYRNIGAAIPIDSSYTKYSLLDLHPNIFVQRSPNQIRQNTFFWAHHEKILVVDHMIAFVGGIDLCFGRWDTPQHSITDNKPSGFEEGMTQADPDNFQLWPGKDYSNPRVQDFFSLEKPYEDMYDRSVVPRMPWHDIHMQIVGQPARDMTRHFVQRWNYLLRQRTPSRPTPVLLPPPDFTEGELDSLGVDGSCEVQILRSACSWSLGTPNRTEKSIQNAYLKAIEMSDHLVYIENQFFITSTNVEGTKIINQIGDALVERIIRAHKNDEDWKAIIVIPLMPGFQNAIDAQDGTSVRLIMHCQFLSISQGENSIFGRLRAADIEPSDYIEFFSLRSWGKLGKPNQEKLVTEQLYIHAKCMVVDDRIAIIGSANINERSMVGDRDSEVAAIIRDTDVIQSTMAGRPYKVGRFPHTLRVRLMREHLGLDVDEIMQDEREEAMESVEQQEQEWEEQIEKWQHESPADIIKDYRSANEEVMMSSERAERQSQIDSEVIQKIENLKSFNHDVDWEQENNPNLKAKKKQSIDPRVTNNPKHEADVQGHGTDHMAQKNEERASMKTPTLTSPKQKSTRRRTGTNPSSRGRDTISSLASPENIRSRSSSHVSVSADREPPLPPYPTMDRMNSYQLGLPQLSQLPPLPNTSDQDIGGPFSTGDPDIKSPDGRNIAPVLPPDFVMPEVNPDMFADPLNENFYNDIWGRIARNNTEIYRNVFRCQPDNNVKTWSAYKDAVDYLERFNLRQDQRIAERNAKAGIFTDEKPGSSGENSANVCLNIPESKEEHQVEGDGNRPRGNSQSSRLNTATTASTTNGTTNGAPTVAGNSPNPRPSGSRGSQESASGKPENGHFQTGSIGYSISSRNNDNSTLPKRRRRGTTKSSRSGDVMDPDRAESTLNMIQGHLVQWPYDWLAKEQEGGNWLYSIDQLAPIEIYD